VRERATRLTTCAWLVLARVVKSSATLMLAGWTIGTATVAVLTVSMCPDVAAAQTTTGVVLGTVKDSDGAVLPGVAVVAVQTTTNGRSDAVTDERGAYVISNLPPGPYRLEASLQGFRQFVREGLALEVQQQLRIDVALQVGVLAETVNVVAGASLLETSTSSVGKVVDTRASRRSR